MKQTLLTALILLLFILACDKEENKPIHFSGFVLDVETGKPLPDALTKLLLSDADPFITQSLVDSINTDNQGNYTFVNDANSFIRYNIFASKPNFVRQGYDRMTRVIAFGKTIDPNHVNIDSIFLGREAVLKININIINELGTYIIYCDEFINVNDTNISLNDYPVSHRIEPYDNISDFVESYLYHENHIVPISWFRQNIPGDSTANGDTTTIQVEMKPLDTIYMSIDLQ